MCVYMALEFMFTPSSRDCTRLLANLVEVEEEENSLMPRIPMIERLILLGRNRGSVPRMQWKGEFFSTVSTI